MNELKDKLAQRRPVVGGWLSIGHPSVAELMSLMEFDFILVDLEHTPISLDAVQQLVHAIEAADTKTQPVIRVPSNDPSWVQRILDTGVTNIMVPKVGTADEARRVVESSQYPPEGSRGIAGSRATGYGLNFEEYVSSINDDILIVAQIENETGIANASEIAATNGITALFVGPADLSGALDCFGRWDSPEYTGAVETIIDRARRHDVPTGTFSADPADVGTQIDHGFDFIIAGKDASHIVNGCREAKDAFYDAASETVER